jgi:hypothetical protein
MAVLGPDWDALELSKAAGGCCAVLVAELSAAAFGLAAARVLLEAEGDSRAVLADEVAVAGLPVLELSDERGCCAVLSGAVTALGLDDCGGEVP